MSGPRFRRLWVRSYGEMSSDRMSGLNVTITECHWSVGGRTILFAQNVSNYLIQNVRNYLTQNVRNYLIQNVRNSLTQKIRNSLIHNVRNFFDSEYSQLCDSKYAQLFDSECLQVFYPECPQLFDQEYFQLIDPKSSHYKRPKQLPFCLQLNTTRAFSIRASAVFSLFLLRVNIHIPDNRGGAARRLFFCF